LDYIVAHYYVKYSTAHEASGEKLAKSFWCKCVGVFGISGVCQRAAEKSRQKSEGIQVQKTDRLHYF
jgi:hypothetical protein